MFALMIGSDHVPNALFANFLSVENDFIILNLMIGLINYNILIKKYKIIKTNKVRIYSFCVNYI